MGHIVRVVILLSIVTEMMILTLKITATNGRWVQCCDICARRELTRLVCAAKYNCWICHSFCCLLFDVIITGKPRWIWGAVPFGRYTCGVQGHTVLDGVPDPPGKGRFGGQTPRQNMQLQIVTAIYQIATRSDSAFSEITLVCLLSFLDYPVLVCLVLFYTFCLELWCWL